MRVCSDITRDNNFKLKEDSFRLDISVKISNLRMVRDWNKLLREAVDTLAVFKAILEGALSNLVYWKVSLPVAGKMLELEDL